MKLSKKIIIILIASVMLTGTFSVQKTLAMQRAREFCGTIQKTVAMLGVHEFFGEIWRLLKIDFNYFKSSFESTIQKSFITKKFFNQSEIGPTPTEIEPTPAEIELTPAGKQLTPEEQDPTECLCREITTKFDAIEQRLDSLQKFDKTLHQSGRFLQPIRCIIEDIHKLVMLSTRTQPALKLDLLRSLNNLLTNFDILLREFINTMHRDQKQHTHKPEQAKHQDAPRYLPLASSSEHELFISLPSQEEVFVECHWLQATFGDHKCAWCNVQIAACDLGKKITHIPAQICCQGSPGGILHTTCFDAYVLNAQGMICPLCKISHPLQGAPRHFVLVPSQGPIPPPSHYDDDDMEESYDNDMSESRDDDA